MSHHENTPSDAHCTSRTGQPTPRLPSPENPAEELGAGTATTTAAASVVAAPFSDDSENVPLPLPRLPAHPFARAAAARRNNESSSDSSEVEEERRDRHEWDFVSPIAADWDAIPEASLSANHGGIPRHNSTGGELQTGLQLTRGGSPLPDEEYNGFIFDDEEAVFLEDEDTWRLDWRHSDWEVPFEERRSETYRFEQERPWAAPAIRYLNSIPTSVPALRRRMTPSPRTVIRARGAYTILREQAVQSVDMGREYADGAMRGMRDLADTVEERWPVWSANLARFANGVTQAYYDAIRDR